MSSSNPLPQAGIPSMKRWKREKYKDERKQKVRTKRKKKKCERKTSVFFCSRFIQAAVWVKSLLTNLIQVPVP